MSSFGTLLDLLTSFEQYLGDPNDQNAPVNFAQSLYYDEQEILASLQLDWIKQWGYNEYLIPQYVGGKLTSLVDFHCINTAIARRDITTAIALGLSFLGALPTWLAGTVAQKEQLAMRLRRGDIIALGLTEEAHGSDLANNETVATPEVDGWQISGEKWCVNYATLGQLITVLCRTQAKGGLWGFSLLMLDKTTLEGITPTPKLPTHGVRGLDISGLRFEKVQVPKSAMLGQESRGLEITYKVFQLTRVLCAGLAIGGADTALRQSLAFSLQRELYGNTAFHIPAVKQRLGELFTQLLLADCTALVVVRACTQRPEMLCFWSAIIKFLIPSMCTDIVEQSAIILGARGYLRTTSKAIMQKIRRDLQVIGLFDGSSQVNLSLIASNLLPQARLRGSSKATRSQLDNLFNLEIDCPELEGDLLRLSVQEEDMVLAGLCTLKAEPIQPLIDAIRKQIADFDQAVVAMHDKKLLDPRGLASFRLAEKYCWLFAASCCLQFWFHNQGTLCSDLKDTQWLQLALQLILQKLQASDHIDKELQETMAIQLCDWYEQNKLFSVLQLQGI